MVDMHYHYFKQMNSHNPLLLWISHKFNKTHDLTNIIKLLVYGWILLKEIQDWGRGIHAHYSQLGKLRSESSSFLWFIEKLSFILATSEKISNLFLLFYMFLKTQLARVLYCWDLGCLPLYIPGLFQVERFLLGGHVGWTSSNASTFL